MSVNETSKLMVDSGEKESTSLRRKQAADHFRSIQRTPSFDVREHILIDRTSSFDLRATESQQQKHEVIVIENSLMF